MGDPRKLRKKYKPPRHPWEKKRIEEESRLVRDFGLKNKKEVWKANTEVSKYRYLARELVGKSAEERKNKEAVLLGKVRKLGLLKEGGSIDDVLSLKVEDLLERRLQTLVWRKGFARTTTQARQFITHGHIAVDGRRVTSPSMIVDVNTEGKIKWYKKPLMEIAKPVMVEKATPQETVKEAKTEGGFACGSCGKKFKSEKGLKIHMKTHK